MNSQEFRTVPVRSAQQIVDQTETLAAHLMKSVYQREPLSDGILLRDSECPRAQHVWRLACEIQGLLTDTDPEDALSELDAEGPVSCTAQAAPAGFVVVQEGGASGEMYAHSFDKLEDAQAFRSECATQGSYRTSQPVVVPSALLARTEFGEVAGQIARAAVEVEYPEE